MRTVVLDAEASDHGDIDWSSLAEFGGYRVYDHTEPTEIVERLHGAEAILVHRARLSGAVIEQLPHLRYVGLLSTGTDAIDVDAAAERGITVTTVSGYAAGAVAQHTFALLMTITNHVTVFADTVRSGAWQRSHRWSLPVADIDDLQDLALGIVGYGTIGREVASVALAFGMRVLVATPHAVDDARLIMSDVDELFREADVVTLHCSLNAETRGMVDQRRLSSMKQSSVLLNTARGALIDEAALAEALHRGELRAAGLDVLNDEPPSADNPLLRAPNCFITPHVAWTSGRVRRELVRKAIENLRQFCCATHA